MGDMLRVFYKNQEIILQNPLILMNEKHCHSYLRLQRVATVALCKPNLTNQSSNLMTTPSLIIPNSIIYNSCTIKLPRGTFKKSNSFNRIEYSPSRMWSCLKFTNPCFYSTWLIPSSRDRSYRESRKHNRRNWRKKGAPKSLIRSMQLHLTIRILYSQRRFKILRRLVVHLIVNLESNLPRLSTITASVSERSLLLTIKYRLLPKNHIARIT